MCHVWVECGAPEPMAMPTENDTDRADRLLGKMHRVLSHDLPNQIVALQSLLQLMEMDDAHRLGQEGRAYVGRLHRVARRAAGMVRFLKEMERLNEYERRVEEMPVASLLREIKAELHQQLDGAVGEYRFGSEVKAVRADPRRLVLAVVEVVRYLLDRFPGNAPVLQLHGQAVPDGMVLCGELSWGAGPPRSTSALPRSDRADRRRAWKSSWPRKCWPCGALS